MAVDQTAADTAGHEAAQQVVMRTIGLIACQAAGIDGATLRDLAQELANGGSTITAPGSSPDYEAAVQQAFRDGLVSQFEALARLLDQGRIGQADS